MYILEIRFGLGNQIDTYLRGKNKCDLEGIFSFKCVLIEYSVPFLILNYVWFKRFLKPTFGKWIFIIDNRLNLCMCVGDSMKLFILEKLG